MGQLLGPLGIKQLVAPPMGLLLDLVLELLAGQVLVAEALAVLVKQQKLGPISERT